MDSRTYLASLALVAACGSSSPGGDDDDAPDAAVEPVYYGAVDRILNENCAMCHSADPDRLAPFSLEGYADAAAAAEAQPIAYEVMNRLMPPFYADDSGACQSFKDNHWLSDPDLAALVGWANGARAMGDPAHASPPPGMLPALPREDAALDIGLDYVPDPSLTDDYRCFVVDAGTTADQFITGYEVRPGNPTVVHHVIAFALDSAAAEQDAIDKDAASDAPGDGYPCVGGSGVSGTSMIGGWAPGGGANVMPADSGIRLPGSRKAILQIHYNVLNSDGTPDRTTVALMLSPTVAKEARIMPVPAPVSLPPGEPDVTAVGTVRIPNAIPHLTVWNAAIHMHNRGLGGTTLRETTGDRCLVDLVNYSFHWQHFYQYETPVELSGGDQLEITCHFDTSLDTETVTWGERTEDEMCIAFLYVTQ